MPKMLKGKAPIDRLDMRVLSALSERGRQTLTELSKSVGLSATPCSARVEKLESDKLIIGYHADVDVERLADLSLYFVTLTAEPWSASLGRKVEAIIRDSPFIISADALFGQIDYIVRIYARSTQHYHEIIQPFVDLGVEHETWPVAYRLMRPNTHRLIAQLAKDSG
jgi:DNA-binding Lrp family transcriptional regulator